MVDLSERDDKPGAAQRPQRPAGSPRERALCVVLGASNVARGLGALVAECRARCALPAEPARRNPAVRAAALRGPEILIATGRGRSYGMRAGVAGLANPGIVSCPLWSALDSTAGSVRDPEQDPADGRVRALVTDVGNDILYGATPREIVGWVATCLERLAEHGASTVVAGLPLPKLAGLSRRQFGFWKRVLFPARHLTYDGAQAAIRELDERLRTVAARAGATYVEPDLAWYGYDPIHVQLRHVPRAWRTLLEPWGHGALEPGAAASDPGGERPRVALLGARLNLARSAGGTLFGRSWRAEQPVWSAPDGTSVGLY